MLSTYTGPAKCKKARWLLRHRLNSLIVELISKRKLKRERKNQGHFHDRNLVKTSGEYYIYLLDERPMTGISQKKRNISVEVKKLPWKKGPDGAGGNEFDGN